MMVEKPTSRGTAVQIGWELARPAWGHALAAFVANLGASVFEGSTIGILVIALHVIGSPADVPFASSFGTWGEWLHGVRRSLGTELLFLILVLLAILSQILRSGLQFAGEAATAFVQARVEAEAHHRIFRRIMRLEFPRVSTYRLGDLTDYLHRTSHLHEAFSELNVLIRSLLFVASYGLLLFWISWPLTLGVLAAYWLVSHLLRSVIRMVRRHAGFFVEKAIVLNQRTTEFLQGIRLIHTFARQEDTIRAMKLLAREGMADRRRATVWASTVEPVTDVLTVVGAGIFLIGGYLVLGLQGTSTLPTLLAFLLALYRLAPRLGAVYTYRAALASRTPSIARIGEILSENEDLDPPTAGRPFPGLRESIEFHEVSLRYRPDEPPALADLSFKAPRGSFTALVGATGAGKSSVADLLLRLFEPTSGQIVVDGVDVRDFQRASWRARCGVVSQDPFLFHASIRDNIAFGNPAATPEEIVDAAKVAHADEFIGRLAEGYETAVGDRGYGLSGGQCQRIALARALVRRPEVLILDEATSALDSASERLIQEALDEQRGTRTILVIAHRLSTVARADQILVLDQGRLVEQGTHENLLAHDGVYARLWWLQSMKHGQAPPPLAVEVTTP